MNSKPAKKKDGWRTDILQHFTKASAAAGRLTVVADPDGLLTEPGVVGRIRDQSYELITFEDHVAFRYAYEAHFRRHWDRGEATHLVVVIRTAHGDLQGIPFDLLEEARAGGRVLSFSLPELFPKLSPNVVAELDYQDFDALADAIRRADPGDLGENATRDFILRHVFEIAPELIKQPPDLLRVLLRRHYRSRVFPASFDERLIQLLSKSNTWGQWPLERIVPSKNAFLTFLGERWPHFLASQGYPVVQGREPASPSISGPTDIPFNHDDVRVYIDNLFAEGLLTPTPAIESEAVKGTWYRIGVVGDPVEDACVRLNRLIESISEALPAEDAGHKDWSNFALRWAEALSLRWRLEEAAPSELAERMATVHEEVEERFAEWMIERYASIHSLPHLPTPTTLDKIPRFLAHHRDQDNGHDKIALIVVDGLALDQWLVLKESLGDYELDEGTSFAWVPTLTSVSRQSIFAGEPPYYYAQYLGSTHREPSHWTRFWDDHGVREPSIHYVRQGKHQDEQVFAKSVREAAEHPQSKVIGIVVGTVDQMMHGTVTGTGGMHAGVRHWAQQGHFKALVDGLLGDGFDVFVTADHGNIEGIGIGKPNVGATADERGERVHIFSDELTRANVQKEYPGSMVWPSIALPDDYLPLLPPGRSAFIREGTKTVGHGGISLEEVIVPFVRITEGT
jgi:hypothetical protein